MQQRAAPDAAILAPTPATGQATPLISLDIVRSLAAFVVMIGHLRREQWVAFAALPAAQKTAGAAAFYAVTRLGNEAVMVFFVLSGFLVGGKLIERVRARRFNLANYALDRATRIFIPLVPACLFTALVMVVLLHQPLGIGEVLANMAGLNGALAPTLAANTPLWSLPFEIWFYVLGAVVALWFARGPNAGLAAALALCALFFAQMGAAFLLFWTLGALMTLAVGMRRPGLLLLVGIAFAAVGLANVQDTPVSPGAAGGAGPRSLAQCMVCIGFCLALPYLCQPRTNRMLMGVRKAALFASGFSYTLYLFHYPIDSALDLLFPKSAVMDGASIGAYAIRLAICLAGSLVFWVLFERNTQAVRRFLTARWTVNAAKLAA